MYPSGPWRGYWEQDLFGRQPMDGLFLRFADGTITGHGTDLIGPFVFRGVYDERGAVTLTKRYLGRHSVHYQGVYDGEGTIHGIWSIAPHWHGKFALSPERGTEPNAAVAAAPIGEITAVQPGPSGSVKGGG